MHVRLKSTFYAGPKYGRFKPASRRNDTVEMPDELRHQLPTSAVVVEAPVVTQPGSQTPTAEEDPRVNMALAEAAAEAKANDEANAQLEVNAKRMQDRLAAEKAYAKAEEAGEPEPEADAIAEALADDDTDDDDVDVDVLIDEANEENDGE